MGFGVWGLGSATAISKSKIGQGINSAASATAGMATGAAAGAAKLVKTAADSKAGKATASAALNTASNLANKSQGKVMNSKIVKHAQVISENIQAKAQEFSESDQGQQLGKTAKHLLGKGEEMGKQAEQKASDLANKASDKLSKLSQKFSEGKNKPPS